MHHLRPQADHKLSSAAHESMRFAFDANRGLSAASFSGEPRLHS
jgi:hypothetical protein